MFFALRVSVLLCLVLVLPASGFLIRTFIVFHDCTHGSFLRSRRANNVLGRAIGLLVWLPFRGWQREHAIHHATAGDLDRRGIGDIKTLTVAEYEALHILGRVGYRLFRNPIVMFGFGWVVVLVLKPRLVPRGSSRRIRNSVLGTNLMLAVIVGGLCLRIGWRDFLVHPGAGVPRRWCSRCLAVLRAAPIRGHLLANPR
jgi:omega-6 fatty acid desaturase (delta-12 desaturase)